MTSFKLSKKSTGRTLTTFHVTNARGDICGHINVPNDAVSDLVKTLARARRSCRWRQ